MPNKPALTIDVTQLRAAADGLLKTVEERHGTRVTIDADLYWLVELRAAFSEDLHRPGEQAGDLGVGQVSDDVEAVVEIVRDLEDPDGWPILWHDLEHVSGVLRALAWTDLSRES